VYDELHMTQRVEQIDSLLAGRTQR
jgi:hypothetical protein